MIDFQTNSLLATLDSNDSDYSEAELQAISSPQATPAAETAGNPHELPIQVPTITNSPRCAPARPSKPQTPTPPRRVRTVRVDAWAVPASVNWNRTRTAVRKVGRGTRSTDWALPF